MLLGTSSSSTSDNPEQGDTGVLGLWVSYLKESWIEGRLRLQRDATEEAWLA